MAQGQNNKTLLYAGIGGGVFLLLTCCCLGGVGGWFFFLRGGPEKKIVGKWILDMDAMKKEPMFSKLSDEQFKKASEEVSKFTVEFKADGAFITNEPGSTGPKTGKWKKIDSKGDVLTIETKEGDNAAWERVEITIVDSTHLKVSMPKGEMKTVYFKKV